MLESSLRSEARRGGSFASKTPGAGGGGQVVTDEQGRERRASRRLIYKFPICPAHTGHAGAQPFKGVLGIARENWPAASGAEQRAESSNKVLRAVGDDVLATRPTVPSSRTLLKLT